MTPTLEELARGLTVPQKRAVMEARSGMIPSHDSRAIRISNPTFKRLSHLGLTEVWPPRLTPLGLTLRAYLEKTQ